MKKSYKYALAIGIIKKAALLIFLFSNYSFSQEFEIDGNEMSVVFNCPDTDADLLFSKINLAVANIYNSATSCSSTSI